MLLKKLPVILVDQHKVNEVLDLQPIIDVFV